MCKQAYCKPAFSVTQLLELYKSCGLVVSDENAALQHIKVIGAHRISQYFAPFSISKGTFKENTLFSNIIKLYNFDRKLRLLSLDAIETIEVALRAIIFNTMSELHTPHWYLNKTLFKDKFKYEDFISNLEKQLSLNNSKKQRYEVREYYQKYNSPELPTSWVVAELVSIGSLCTIYVNLKDKNDRIEIAKQFDMQSRFFAPYIQTFASFRNRCAHHERIWDVEDFKPLPTVSKSLSDYIPISSRKCYPSLAILQLLRMKITTDNSFAENLKDLLNNHCPLPYKIPMGFPNDWQNYPIWN